MPDWHKFWLYRPDWTVSGSVFAGGIAEIQLEGGVKVSRVSVGPVGFNLPPPVSVSPLGLVSALAVRSLGLKVFVDKCV